MELKISKLVNGNEVLDLTCELTSMQEVINSTKTILGYISNKVAEVFAGGLPYKVVNEEGAIGFVSDVFQYISCKNYICIIEGDKETHFKFSSYLPSLCQVVEQELLEAA